MIKLNEYINSEDKLLRIETLIIVSISIVLILLTLKAHFIIILICPALWAIYWTYNYRKLPKNKYAEKFGIVFLFETESEKQKIRLKSDFFKRITEQISQNGLTEIIQPVLATNHQAKKHNPFLTKIKKVSNELKKKNPPQLMSENLQDQWNTFQRKTNCHLFIWGEIKERKQNSSKYFLETSIMVVHSPVKPKYQQQLSQDIDSIWMRLLYFLEEEEYEGFNISAEMFLSAAKYILGTAVLLSGDAKKGLAIHKDLVKELKVFSQSPNYKQIEKRLTKLIAEEYVILSAKALGLDNHNSKEHLEKAFEYNPTSYSAYLLKAVFEFIADKDPNKALKTIRKSKSFANNNKAWKYSEAFLLLELGEYKKGLKSYDSIVKGSFLEEDSVLQEVVNFNLNLLHKNPSKVESYFILGFVFYKKIANYPQALSHLNNFLDSVGRNKKYEILVKRAKRYKREIETSMGI